MSGAGEAGGSRGLPSGARVGAWQVVRRLGEGGFGAVYEAVQPELGRRVAIKVLDATYARREDLSLRFVREARAVTQIGHPNIVDIFAFGNLPDGRPYYVMELVDGPSLARRLEEGPLPVPDAQAILLDVALALEAAHEAGVVHRDLKPANVMLVLEQGRLRAKLLDFGIAKLVDREAGDGLQTATGVLLGTPAYMSPEQCMGPNVGPGADVYSLGVMLFEMLTGQRPFRDATSAQLIVAHLHKSAPPPSAVQPGLPADVDRLVLGLLDKSPQRRLPLSAAIGWARGQPLARPAAPPAAAPPPPARRWALGGATLTMAAVGLAGLLTWYRAPVDVHGAPVAPATPSAPSPAAPDEVPAPARPAPREVPTAPVAPPPIEPPPAPGPKAPATSTKRGPPPAPERRRRAGPAKKGTGFLSLTTQPWTQVEVDGVPLGTTPLYRVPLAAGRHVLRMRNPEAGIDEQRAVRIEAGVNRKVRHELAP